MAVMTSNKYGKIVVSDEAVAMCAHRAASECYGVMELVSKGFTDSVSSLFKKKAATKGVKVTTIDNRIFIDLYVVLKEGVLAEAVSFVFGMVAFWLFIKVILGMAVARVVFYRELQNDGAAAVAGGVS